MKWFLYYAVIMSVNIISVFLFGSSINIDESSVSPVLLLLLSAFLSVYYYTNRKKEDFSTNYYGIEFTEEEWERVSLYTRQINAAVLPLYIPFIFFFPLLIKLIVPVLIFIISIAGGTVFYRIKFRKELHSRFENEKRELEEQKKLEESGRWKE